MAVTRSSGRISRRPATKVWWHFSRACLLDNSLTIVSQAPCPSSDNGSLDARMGIGRARGGSAQRWRVPSGRSTHDNSMLLPACRKPSRTPVLYLDGTEISGVATPAPGLDPQAAEATPGGRSLASADWRYVAGRCRTSGLAPRSAIPDASGFGAATLLVFEPDKLSQFAERLLGRSAHRHVPQCHRH
jgi:hypothetical protein